MKHPFRQLSLLAALALACAVAACVPKERFAWSPAGEEAAVILDGSLRIVDEEGRKVREFPDRDGSSGTLRVESAAWTPDGRQLLVRRVRMLSKWEEVLDALEAPGEGQTSDHVSLHEHSRSYAVSEIEKLARAVPSLLDTAIVLHHEADRPESLLASLDSERALFLAAALRLAWEREPGKIRATLERYPHALPILTALEKREPDEWTYALHEIALLDWMAPEGEGRILAQGFRALSSPSLSPDGDFVGYASKAGATKTYDLVLRDVKEWGGVLIAEGVDEAFAWTEDGRSLVTVAPLLSEDALLKQIRRIDVLGADGSLRDAPEDAAGAGAERWPTETLATILMPFTPRLDVLPGGEILFAAQSGELPLVGDSPEFDARFFRLDTETGELSTVPTAEGALPMDLGYFALSPDGERIAVVEAASDAVAVVEMESGRSEIVSPAHPGWKCRALPAWRNDTELTYAALSEEEPADEEGSAESRVRWMAWDAASGERRELGSDWAPEATAAWLEKKKKPVTDQSGKETAGEAGDSRGLSAEARRAQEEDAENAEDVERSRAQTEREVEK